MNSNGHQKSAAIATINELRQGAGCDFTALLKRLRTGVQKRDIRKREGRRDRNGRTHYVNYVEWQVVADLLDRLVPEWSYAVRSISQIGEFVVATAAITINGVTREGIGAGSANSEIGIKKAEHDALKCAAAKFGVARELYRDEEKFREPFEDEDNDDERVALTFDPLAKTKNDLISPKQLSLISSLAKRARQDPEELCRTTYKAGLAEISRKAASALIDHLHSLIPPIPQ